MTNKELVIEAVRSLSETLTLDEISEEVALLAAIRKGEEAAEAGRVTPHEEVRRMVTSWSAR